MTDANVQAVDGSNDIGTKLERLAANFDKLSDQLAKFSGAVVQTLSGQPASAPSATASAPVKRRGRPPKNAAATPLIAQPEAAPAVKGNASHPLALQAMSIIERKGRVTQTELAEEMKIQRSAVEYHTNALLAEGKIVKRTVRPNGVKTILFYRHDWAHFKGE